MEKVFTLKPYEINKSINDTLIEMYEIRKSSSSMQNITDATHANLEGLLNKLRKLMQRNEFNTVNITVSSATKTKEEIAAKVLERRGPEWYFDDLFWHHDGNKGLLFSIDIYAINYINKSAFAKIEYVKMDKYVPSITVDRYKDGDKKATVYDVTGIKLFGEMLGLMKACARKE
jgi:hypothetical protein